jgi:hypothetical protein
MSDEPLPSSVRLLLKSEDQPPRDLHDLSRSELEVLRSAITSSLQQLAVAEREATGPREYPDFTCEWWPPD